MKWFSTIARSGRINILEPWVMPTALAIVGVIIVVKLRALAVILQLAVGAAVLYFAWTLIQKYL